jgi:hypothetical protein
MSQQWQTVGGRLNGNGGANQSQSSWSRKVIILPPPPKVSSRPLVPTSPQLKKQVNVSLLAQAVVELNNGRVYVSDRFEYLWNTEQKMVADLNLNFNLPFFKEKVGKLVSNIPGFVNMSREGQRKWAQSNMPTWIPSMVDAVSDESWARMSDYHRRHYIYFCMNVLCSDFIQTL